jgi:hypothetical protein
MLCRIVNWSSQGYIYQLGTVPEQQLKPGGPYTAHTRDRNNLGLARVMLMMADQGMIGSIMERCGRSEWRSERFTNLLSAFARLDEQDTPQLHLDMYSADTCVEFHRLLVGTLLAFANALFVLGEQERSDVSGRKEACKQVWIVGGLLREIASSLMLRQHLKSCTPWLSIPTNDERHLRSYKQYTGFPHEGCRDPTPDDPGLSNDLNLGLNGSEELDEVFLEWIRLQVIHWLSLGAISRSFGSPSYSGVELGVTLLAVKYPDRPRPVEPWKTTVHNLVSRFSRSYSAEDVIQCIISSVPSPCKPNQHPVFKKWAGTVAGGAKSVKFDSTVHCEAALASLAKYADYIPIKQMHIDLTALLQVCFAVVIIILINLTGA